MLELVILDADGVLFDSTESNIAYYNAIFTHLGEAPLSPEEERAGIFMSAVQMFEERAAGDARRVARMREVARALDSTPFFKLLRPYPGLRAFLLQLRQRQRLGLATNRSATVPAIVEYLGLADVFDVIASARDRVRPKPAPDILELCLKRAGVVPEHSLYVGDSEIDRLAASAAGMTFVGLGERVDHQHRIATLAELPALLPRLFSR